MYESDITRFIRELKASRPHLEADQRKGRAILWDREPVTPEEAQRTRASELALPPYVYHTKA